MTTTQVECGSMGRVAYARLAPNEDLVQGVEKLCVAEGFCNAFVRGALGSLVDGSLAARDGRIVQVRPSQGLGRTTIARAPLRTARRASFTAQSMSCRARGAA